MLELSWLAESVRIWLEGGDLRASVGFSMLVVFLAIVAGPSLLAMAIGGCAWHETWLGRWFGAKAPDQDWKYRAGDTDKDGLTDF